MIFAGVGLALLWTATQSMAWIDNVGGTLTLTELGDSVSGINEFPVVEWYADWGWKLLFSHVVLVGVLATLVNPTSSLLRTVLWFPLAGPLAFFNLTDRGGTVAPRVLGCLALLGPTALFGALWVDLRVQPEFDSSGRLPEDISPEALAELENLPDGIDPATLGDLNSIDAAEALGFNMWGFESSEIGSGLWMSFAALALVAVGAIIGTRAAKT